MTRLSIAEIAALRPRRGVRITKRVTCGGHSYDYFAACGNCDWLRRHSLRVIVEEQAREHRHQHRAAVPA